MAYNGGYNYASVGHDEIFDPRRTPMPFRMDVEEIVEPLEIEVYGHNNQHPIVLQGSYVLDQIPYPMDQRELQEISVPIYLSSTRNIDSLMATLYRDYELGCSLAGNVLTVTGYSFSGPYEFLNIVREVSRDRGAYIVRRR